MQLRKNVFSYCSFLHVCIHFFDSDKLIHRLLSNIFSFFSYALFDMDGEQISPDLVSKVGEAFESILKEVYLIS